MRGFIQDLRYSIRQLRKSPAFAITAVLTLALGIGANVAVFTVMNATLLNPSGVPHPDGVVALRAGYNIGDLANIAVSPVDFEDAVEGKRTFSSVAVMDTANYNYAGDSANPELLHGAQVSWQWFDVFWAHPLLGRVFRAEEDQPGAEHEVVLSYAAWKSRFGGDPGIVGRKLQLNRSSYEVIGVMGPDFAWPNTAELWTPLALPPSRYTDLHYRFYEYLFGAARLKPGATFKDANAYLAMKTQEGIASAGSTSSFARDSGWHEFCMPLVEFVAGDMRKPLGFLLAAVGLVLLIACANIAGLQSARASARQREVSIQIALGSSRARLIRQAFAESLLLASGGIVLGLVFAKLSVPLLLALAPESVSRNVSAHISPAVLLFVTAIGVLCAVICGTAPSWHMTRVRSFQALQEGGRGDTDGRSRQRLRSILVVTEIATAMLLLFAAGLLISSLARLQRVQTGFEPNGIVTGALTLPPTVYKTDPQLASFYSALETQLKAVPGVTNAAVADALPFSGSGGAATFTIQGQTLSNHAPPPHGNVRSISPDYFATLGIGLLHGRTFTGEDRTNTQPVAIVDETLARQYWPGQDPVGQHIQMGGPGSDQPLITVVGIVQHARASSLESDTREGFYYLPMAQSPGHSAFIAVKSKQSPASLASSLRNAIRTVDSSQALYDVKTMNERVDESLVGRRFLVVLLSVFAGLALLLSAIGLYGVISYSVKLRTRELGVRMALGAQRSDVLQLVLGRGLQLAVIGLVAGLLASFALGRVLNSLLYHVSVFNPVALLATSSLLAATVLIASYLPARRAAHLDPMRTLREE